MKTMQISFVAFLALVALCGCSGEATSQADINSAAGELQKKSEGVTPQPDPAVVQMGGGGGGTAKKPGH